MEEKLQEKNQVLEEGPSKGVLKQTTAAAPSPQEAAHNV